VSKQVTLHTVHHFVNGSFKVPVLTGHSQHKKTVDRLHFTKEAALLNAVNGED